MNTIEFNDGELKGLIEDRTNLILKINSNSNNIIENELLINDLSSEKTTIPCLKYGDDIINMNEYKDSIVLPVSSQNGTVIVDKWNCTTQYACIGNTINILFKPDFFSFISSELPINFYKYRWYGIVKFKYSGILENREKINLLKIENVKIYNENLILKSNRKDIEIKITDFKSSIKYNTTMLNEYINEKGLLENSTSYRIDNLLLILNIIKKYDNNENLDDEFDETHQH